MVSPCLVHYYRYFVTLYLCGLVQDILILIVILVHRLEFGAMLVMVSQDHSRCVYSIGFARKTFSNYFNYNGETVLLI